LIRFVVGDVAGTQIAEIEPDIGPISWRLNDIGRVQFALAKTDAKVTEAILRFGNRVLIEFDNGLPDWGGVIDTPREWGLGMVTCNAYGGEQILGYRQTDKTRAFEGDAIGVIYQALLSEATAAKNTGITIGSIWHGGDTHALEYHYKNILAIIRETLCGSLSDYDYDVTGSLDSGKIVLAANLYERKGYTKNNCVLIEGLNVSDAKLVEQGQIINSWDLVGAGSDWGPDRPTAHAEDAASIGRYGLRQGQAIFNDIVDQNTLQSMADNLLSQSKDVHAMFDLSTVNISGPGGFADYDVGDTVRLQLHSYGFGGFDGLITIEAREYNPASGECRLIVREA